jgi:hypothetical protein
VPIPSEQHRTGLDWPGHWPIWGIQTAPVATIPTVHAQDAHPDRTNHHRGRGMPLQCPRPPALCRRPLPLVLIRRYLLPLFPIATRSSSASLCAEPSRRSATRPSPTPPRLGQPEVPPRAPPPNLDEHDVASSKRGANAWPDTTPRAEEPLLPPSMLS